MACPASFALLNATTLLRVPVLPSPCSMFACSYHTIPGPMTPPVPYGDKRRQHQHCL
ncbi:hypothetical protein FIBSPDRAFT_873816 [Athelia psychrophila]|uniref:Uncharacterized protein n=1 Tax=Athelia psychrophila TaxID=1759441 RepID=A0A165Y4H6_9AGAM|nr:hypothetical protein FIBSPDRAFT_873816 [Fibularhizoctonia sp. CBS 109695]